MITPYPFQMEAINAVHAKWASGVRSLLLSMPTGSGKTITFTRILRDLMEGNQTRALIVVHREELLKQAVKTLKKKVWPECEVGIVCSTEKDFSKRITVASVQTLSNKSSLRKLHAVDWFIVDEAHHTLASTWMAVCERVAELNPEHRMLGVTATPTRTNKKELLSDVYQEIAYSVSIFRLIKEGFLSPITGYSIPTNLDLKRVRITGADYNKKDLGTAIARSNFNAVVVEGYLTKARGSKAICFAVDVEQIHILVDYFNSNKIKARGIHGGMSKKEREKILSDFTKNKFKVLVNCEIATEGFDEESIECVIMARPTKSIILFTQCIGRGLRIFPGKKECILLDFTDNSKTLGLMTLKDLIAFYEMKTASRMLEERGGDDVPIVIDRRTIPGFHMLEEIGEKASISGLNLFDISTYAWAEFDGNRYVTLRKDFSLAILKDDKSTGDDPVYDVYLCYLARDRQWVSKLNMEGPCEYELAVGTCNWYLYEFGDKNFIEKDRQWKNNKASVAQMNLIQKLFRPYKSFVRGTAVNPFALKTSGVCSNFITAILSYLSVKNASSFINKDSAIPLMMKTVALNHIPQSAFDNTEPHEYGLNFAAATGSEDCGKFNRAAFLLEKSNSAFLFNFYLKAVIHNEPCSIRLTRQTYPPVPLTDNQMAFLVSRITPVMKSAFPSKSVIIEG